MFEITENNILKNGIVKYEDEFGNKLMIITDKLGNMFKIKLRPAIVDTTFDSIQLDYPYVVAGLNLKYHYSSEEEREAIRNTPGFMTMLYDVIEIAERWVQISRSLKALSSNDLDKLSYLLSNQNLSRDCIASSLIESELKELYQYRETKAFVMLYGYSEGNSDMQQIKIK